MELLITIHYTLIRQHYYEKKHSQGLEKRQKNKPQVIVLRLTWLALSLTCCVTSNKPLYCSGLLFPSQLSHEECFIICKATHQLMSCLLNAGKEDAKVA